MIKSFRAKETEKIWRGQRSMRLPQDIQQIARRKLRIIKNARSLNDLRVPPANRLEVLLEEFLVPMGISQNRIARNMGVPPRRINEIVHGKRAVTADTALRLARYFGTSEEFWMGLQADYDLEEARHKLGNRLIDEVSTHAA